MDGGGVLNDAAIHPSLFYERKQKMKQINKAFPEVDPRYFYMDGDILSMKGDRWVITAEGARVYIPKKKKIGTGWLRHGSGHDYYIHEIKGPLFKRLKPWNNDPIVKLKNITGTIKIYRVSQIERRLNHAD